jgi:hypothetical protein
MITSRRMARMVRIAVCVCAVMVVGGCGRTPLATQAQGEAPVQTASWDLTSEGPLQDQDEQSPPSYAQLRSDPRDPVYGESSIGKLPRAALQEDALMDLLFSVIQVPWEDKKKDGAMIGMLVDQLHEEEMGLIWDRLYVPDVVAQHQFRGSQGENFGAWQQARIAQVRDDLRRRFDGNGDATVDVGELKGMAYELASIFFRKGKLSHRTLVHRHLIALRYCDTNQDRHIDSIEQSYLLDIARDVMKARGAHDVPVSCLSDPPAADAVRARAAAEGKRKK